MPLHNPRREVRKFSENIPKLTLLVLYVRLSSYQQESQSKARQANLPGSLLLTGYDRYVAGLCSEHDLVDVVEGFDEVDLETFLQVVRQLFVVLAVVFREDQDLKT